MTTQATREELQNEISLAHFQARRAAIAAAAAQERARIFCDHYRQLLAEYKQLFSNPETESQ